MVATLFLLNGLFLLFGPVQVYEHTTVRFCAVQFTFFLVEVEQYHCNPCNLIFSSLKLENGLKKHVARIKYGSVELVVFLFSFNTRCYYVIPSDFEYDQTPIPKNVNI